MNVKLLTRVREALRTQENRIKLRGYKGLSRADLEMVLFLVDTHQTPNYLSSEAQKLYDDIVS